MLFDHRFNRRVWDSFSAVIFAIRKAKEIPQFVVARTNIIHTATIGMRFARLPKPRLLYRQISVDRKDGIMACKTDIKSALVIGTITTNIPENR